LLVRALTAAEDVSEDAGAARHPGLVSLCAPLLPRIVGSFAQRIDPGFAGDTFAKKSGTVARAEQTVVVGGNERRLRAAG